MSSPFIRHQRLVAELIAERKRRRLTTRQLAIKAYASQSKIVRIENMTSAPNLADVQQYLEGLGITDGDRWQELVTLTMQASERGWWEDYMPYIGKRQAVYANIEWGAQTITEYSHYVVPGLLQIPEYVGYRRDWGAVKADSTDVHKRTISARMMRQRMLARPDGPVYEAIIEENALRRLSAPLEVTLKQLQHLADMPADTRVGFRVLPMSAQMPDFWWPRSSFSHYTFDGGDPDALAVDGEVSDHITINLEEVEPYRTLVSRLRDAALPPDESRELVTKLAVDLSSVS